MVQADLSILISILLTIIYCNLENFEMYSFIFFSPTLYVGEYEHGFFATNSLVDEATVTVAVSTHALSLGSKKSI